jgi:hypothetical protein
MMLLRRVLTRFTEHGEDFRWPLTDLLEAGQIFPRHESDLNP